MKKIFFSSKTYFSIIVLILIVIILYGVASGLLIFCVILSAISDGIVIVFSKDLISSKNNILKTTVKIQKFNLPIFVTISIITHSITYYILGSKSLILIPLTFVLLLTIYLLQKFMINKNE